MEGVKFLTCGLDLATFASYSRPLGKFRFRNRVRMNYRREIDGLRAVAVLPVILFHAGFSVFSGGYIGVDVFFVISGYLITSILISELEEERFSIVRFYERRAKRILPALFSVMLACLPLAYMWMLPSQLKDFAQSLVAVVFFGSNILFWSESGYFAADAELKPLLHTWSLAVEEQYYLLFPIFLLLAWRFGRSKVFWSVVVIAAISLLLSEWGWRNKPSANFYLAPTRAWELLVGSICAFLTVGRAIKSNNILSAIGLVAIVFAIFCFDEDTPFPSIYALVPVVGTAMIILFGRQGTWVAKLLSKRSFVGIGLISYSAYLWHQPLFAFARLRNLTEPSHVLMGLLAVIALLLAWATWYFVEQPFRRGSNPLLVTRRSVFAWSGSVGAVFVALGLAGHFNDGFSQRKNGNGLSFEELHARIVVNPGISRECIEQRDISVVVNNSNCQVGDDPKILLWGDSYAMHLYQALSQNSMAQKIGIRQIALSQCMPNLSLARNGSETLAHECISFNSQVAAHIAESNYEFVIMASPFNRIGSAHYDENGEQHFIEDATDLVNLLIETGEYVESLGATPIFVLPPPTNGSNLGNCFIGSIWRGQNPSACDYLESEISSSRLAVYTAMQGIVSRYSVVDFRELLCVDKKCISHIDSTPVYRDEGHFSVSGSRLIGEMFDPFARTLFEQ